ncbi:MAG: Wzt carbohydrate-binding domain-containing protein, partial [Planctomycetota bacterium]
KQANKVTVKLDTSSQSDNDKAIEHPISDSKTNGHTFDASSSKAATKHDIGTGEMRITGFEILDNQGNPVTVLAVGNSYTFHVILQSTISYGNIGLFLQFVSEDARVAFSTHSYAYINDKGCECATKIPIVVGGNVIKLKIPNLLLGAGRYFVSAGVAPHKNTNTYDEYFDVKWKRWAIAVQRKGLMQLTVFEQPVSNISVNHISKKEGILHQS